MYYSGWQNLTNISCIYPEGKGDSNLKSTRSIASWSLFTDHNYDRSSIIPESPAVADVSNLIHRLQCNYKTVQSTRSLIILLLDFQTILASLEIYEIEFSIFKWFFVVNRDVLIGNVNMCWIYCILQVEFDPGSFSWWFPKKRHTKWKSKSIYSWFASHVNFEKTERSHLS